MITERLTKQQFISQGLDNELFTTLKNNIEKEALKLTVSWYDGNDLNNVHTLSKYVAAHSLDVDESIREDINFIFDNITDNDVLVLVRVQWIVSTSGSESDTGNCVASEVRMLDYKIPTAGWTFNEYLNKWVQVGSDYTRDYVETFIVKQLGISLSSVENITIDKQEDGQLKEIKIDFVTVEPSEDSEEHETPVDDGNSEDSEV